MLRRGLAHYLLTVTFLLNASIATVSAASPGLTGGAPIEKAAAIHGSASVDVAIDGPGHHFGFTQASIMAQVSPVPLAGLQQLSNISVSGWTAANPPSFDIQSFDPVRGVIYIAARNPGSGIIGNSGPGLIAIDTAT